MIVAAGEMGEATVVTTAAVVELSVPYLLAWEDGLAADVPAFFGAVLTLRRNLLILLAREQRSEICLCSGSFVVCEDCFNSPITFQLVYYYAARCCWCPYCGLLSRLRDFTGFAVNGVNNILAR